MSNLKSDEFLMDLVHFSNLRSLTLNDIGIKLDYNFILTNMKTLRNLSLEFWRNQSTPETLNNIINIYNKYRLLYRLKIFGDFNGE